MGLSTPDNLQTQSEQSQVLPALQLTESRRSPKPVVEAEKVKDTQTFQVGDYTMVITDGASEIVMVDDHGLPVEDFRDKAKLGKKMLWDTVLSKLESNYQGVANYEVVKGHISIDMVRSAFGSEVSKELSKIISKFGTHQTTSNSLDGGPPKYMGRPSVPKELIDINLESPISLSIIGHGAYILIIDIKNKWIVFRSQKNGKDLAPRQWDRLSSLDNHEFPEDIRSYIDIILNKQNGAKSIDIGSRNLAFIDPNEVRIANNTDGSTVYKETVKNVGNNLCIDPNNPHTIYLCRGENTSTLVKLNTEGNASDWRSEEAHLPQIYDKVEDLQLDPTGELFMFNSGDNILILDKTTLKEIGRYPKLSAAKFDQDGRIRGINETGHLVIYDTNLGEIARKIKAARIAQAASGLNVADVFAKVRGIVSPAVQAQAKDWERDLGPTREKFNTDFSPHITVASTREDISQLRQTAKEMERALMNNQKLKADEARYILAEVNESLGFKEREIVTQLANESVARLKTRFVPGSLSLASVADFRREVDDLKGMASLVDDTLKKEIQGLSDQLESETQALFKRQKEVIIADVKGYLERVKLDLETISSQSGLDSWVENDLPQKLAYLANLQRDCPLEAIETYKVITDARLEVHRLAKDYQDKFELQYAKVREEAAKQLDTTIGVIHGDIDALVKRLQHRKFKTRTEAESYIANSQDYQRIVSEITALEGNLPEAAKKLQQTLDVQLANAYFEIERKGKMQIADTGQQMEFFGNTPFPVWEARVKEKVEPQFDLIFIPNESTKTAGITAEKIIGDIGIRIMTEDGHEKVVRLFESKVKENEWRYGGVSHLGDYIPASYLPMADYKSFKRDYLNWNLGERSSLRQELTDKRQALSQHYQIRQKPGQRDNADSTWRAEYRRLFTDYTEFCAQHHIDLLRRVDQIRKEPLPEFANGKGYVPEWQNHWVSDPTTESNLEEMAQLFKMQLDLQADVLDLKGHAGTGKDVLIKMFCARAKRPYFAMDCTKWTTEFEIGEDVILTSQDGASQTVWVPSVILNGIVTPGALVYFNEVNGMTEQAQIFLHALWDEKRTMTLKTSGRTIRADKTVLMAASENPGYPGTFDLQMATKSRTVPMEIGYPQLLENPDDPAKSPYNVAEALRIARGVDSFTSTTYDPNLERNQFARIWQQEINGKDQGIQLSTEQKYDLDVIFALVTFSQQLRNEFIKVFEKSSGSHKALPVTQPLTGRELRRCAYMLSQMKLEDKAANSPNPEAAARQLLERFFLIHIDKQEDRQKIKTAMATWTTSKRRP